MPRISEDVDIYVGQRWANRTRHTTIEVVGRDQRRPRHLVVMLHSVGLETSLSVDELLARYRPADAA